MTAGRYLGEIGTGWRPLLAASLGLASGMPLQPFVTNLLAPHMVQAMGWSKADFALAAMAGSLGILAYPVVGRAADRYGLKPVAGLGLLVMVLCYAAIGLMAGGIAYYIVLASLQVMFGAATTGPVFLRLVVGNFDRSRGLALAIAVSTPALVAACGSPLLSAFIAGNGWRAGAFAVAAYAIVSGSLALLLAPADGPRMPVARQDGGSPTDFRPLLADPAFRLLAAVTILVSMPLVLTNSQLGLVLIESGMSTAAAGQLLSLFAVGVIAGRFAAGFALDRFEAELVGVIGLSLPAFGMLLLASPFDQPAALAFAVLLIGLAGGAEGDILAYIVSRRFGAAGFGAGLGIVFAAVCVSALVGGLVLNQSLRLFESYATFLIFGSASVVLGSALLFLLRPRQGADSPLEATGAEPHG